MKKTQETLQSKDNTKTAVLYIAFELSHRKWKLAFSNGEKMRTVTIEARNLEKLQAEINKAKKRFRIDKELQVVSCYEAGRDGFWLHRYLLSCGIDNVVVDSASIEVNRSQTASENRSNRCAQASAYVAEVSWWGEVGLERGQCSR